MYTDADGNTITKEEYDRLNAKLTLRYLWLFRCACCFGFCKCPEEGDRFGERIFFGCCARYRVEPERFGFGRG